MLDPLFSEAFTHAPNGHTIAVHIQGMYLILGDIIFDANNRPTGIKLGPVMQPGKFLSIGRWSLDSRHYVVSDTKWGPKPADSVTTHRGELISIAVDGLSGKVVSTATVSLSPEGMEINRTGGTIPSSGCCHRINASAPINLPVTRLICG